MPIRHLCEWLQLCCLHQQLHGVLWSCIDMHVLRERLLFEWIVVPKLLIGLLSLQQQHSLLDVRQRLLLERLVMRILPQFLHSLH
jgi:hypothetical protein